MIVGFATYHATSRSKLALLCCLYAGGYEVYFITSGTVADEQVVKVNESGLVSRLSWLEQQADRAEDDYLARKKRYEDPSDKMNGNAWYKAKYVDPAWKVYSEAQKQLNEFRDRSMEEQTSFDHSGFLKILFRLGLVILFMVSIHNVMRYFYRLTDVSCISCQQLTG